MPGSPPVCPPPQNQGRGIHLGSKHSRIRGTDTHHPKVLPVTQGASDKIHPGEADLDCLMRISNVYTHPYSGFTMRDSVIHFGLKRRIKQKRGEACGTSVFCILQHLGGGVFCLDFANFRFVYTCLKASWESRSWLKASLLHRNSAEDTHAV